jgi:nucleoside-diphosphate-sugar epimerase
MVMDMTQGAMNVLEAVRLMQVERFIYFSSIGILPSVQYQPIDANHPTLMAAEGPGSGGYGISKLMGEGLCWAYHQAYGVDFVVLRPSAAYGFHTANPTIYLNQMVEGALLGEKRFWDHGGAMPRDFTHVHDIAGITSAALNVPATKLKHRVFYAASGQPLVTSSQCAAIVRSLVPSADIQIYDGMNELDRLGIRFRGVVDMQPVVEQLGYSIKYTDIRAGIVEYMDRFDEYLRAVGKTSARHNSR